MSVIKLQGEAESKAGVYYEYDTDSKPLGEGGMGRVFKGYRVVTRTGERTTVAIKAIYENIPERIVERARREASIQVDHDSLIKMYGFVETESQLADGSGRRQKHYHVIMELLVGVTVEDLLNGITTDKHGATIPYASELLTQLNHNRMAAVVRIMKPVLSGVMALHDRGIIHRDIDPSNIMVTLDGKIKLIDFGICKQVVNLGSQDKGLTATGVFMGKVNYAAPELVVGDVKNQNYTTDIYALGVLLYQLTTGRLPFSGTDQDILAANLRKKFPMGPVKQADIRKVIRKASEKSQSKRYSSAAEMRVALEHVNPDGGNGLLGNWKLITAAVVGIAVVCGILYAVMPGEDEDTEDVEETVETVAVEEQPVVKIPTSADLYAAALAGLSSLDADSVRAAHTVMTALANDSLYAPAIFEYALTYAAPNRRFPELEKRQQLLGISPDREMSNTLLRRASQSDINDARPLYWIVSNYVDEAKENFTLDSRKLNDLRTAISQFGERSGNLGEKEGALYRAAMNDDVTTLTAWGLL